MKTKYIFLIFALFLIIFNMSFIEAQLKDVKAGDCVNIKIPLNASWVNITTITYPNQTMITLSVLANKVGNTFYYNSFCDTINGCYSYEFFDDTGYSSGNTFCVTPNGETFNTSQSFLFIGFLVLFILFLIAGIWGLANSVNGAWQIAYICLAYISLFAIFFICWLYSTNYLWATPILASIFWILWLVLAFGFLPFILVIGTYIVGKGIKDNLFKTYKSQGFSDEEAKEMAYKNKR